MKRVLILVLTALLAFSISVSAQVKVGVTAGMNFNSAIIKDVKMDARAGWNAGLTLNLDLPLGFSVQPSLLYMQKSAGFEVADLLSSSAYSSYIEELKAKLVQNVGSVVLPVSLQWGPDLLIARPFIDVTPYLGYSVVNVLDAELSGVVKTLKGGNGLEYGVGIGAGLNVWNLQAIIRYNWNYGVLGSYKDFTNLDLGNLSTENEKFGGITVSLAYFF